MKTTLKTKSIALFLPLVFTQIVSAQNFTEVAGTPFAGVAQSSIAFADVDGDNDPDVLITGLNFEQQPPGVRISKLYINDGSGNFTKVLGTPFAGVEKGSVAFTDVDGDNDQDVLITGRSDAGFTAKLYTNDGSGNFTEVLGTPFVGVEEGSIAFADVDDDNDQDVLITGRSDAGFTAKLYTNDGSGNFTEVIGTPFQGVNQSSIAFADVDGDNDLDVLITGSPNGTVGSAKLYLNDGAGNFTEVMGTPFDAVFYGAIAFADIDGDNDQDLLITGTDGSAGISKLYTNDGLGNFTEVVGAPFPGLMGSAVAFADVDGDNDLDVLMTGGVGSFSFEYTGLYTNDGSGNFTEVTDTPFSDLVNGSIAFADVDGDNNQDVLITGQDPGNYIAKLYLNAGVPSSSNDLFVDANLKLTLFPNPATSDNLQIRFNSTRSNTVTVRVYDMNGHLISQQKESVIIGDQTLVIDIAALSSGSYFIQLENGNHSGVAKFVIR